MNPMLSLLREKIEIVCYIIEILLVWIIVDLGRHFQGSIYFILVSHSAFIQ